MQDEPVMTDLVFNGTHLWMYPHGDVAHSPWRFLLRNGSFELKNGLCCQGETHGVLSVARFVLDRPRC